MSISFKKNRETWCVPSPAVWRFRLFWMLRTRNNYAQLVHMSGSPSSAVFRPQRNRNSDWAPGLPARWRGGRTVNHGARRP